MFITIALHMLIFFLPPAEIPVAHAHAPRQEICPGAVYFIKRGHHASWQSHKRLLCRIGDHDFYGDKK